MADMWFSGLKKELSTLFLFIMRTLLQNKESGQNPAHYATLNTVFNLPSFWPWALAVHLLSILQEHIVVGSECLLENCLFFKYI